MSNNRKEKWQQYKSDFLKANHCTAGEFEQAYIAFMETKPDTNAYREFARQYHIIIHPEPRLPEDMQVLLSVNISAIKVMARSYRESLAVMAELLQSIP